MDLMTLSAGTVVKVNGIPLLLKTDATVEGSAASLDAASAALSLPERQPHNVDWLGHALDLEAQAKRVESQTVERAMLAGAHALRLMGAAAAMGEQK